MKVLIISQYFWPENFRINDIALGLSNKNIDVTILTGFPNYPKGKFFQGYKRSFFKNQKWNNINIERSWLIPRKNSSPFNLILNYISFSIFASIRVLFMKNKFDKIFVYQPSPVTVGIPALIAKYKFKKPIYFWVQDLWPESITAATGNKNKLILFCANLLTKFIYKGCDKILVQSKAFIPYIESQKINKNKIIYLPNSIENDYKKIKSNKFINLIPEGNILMFAGNLGESQSFETLIKTAVILKKKNQDIKWVILGDGRMKNQIKSMIKSNGLEKNFILLGSFDIKYMPIFFSYANAMIVSLKNEKIFSLTIPAKIQSYMACEKPILASINGEGRKIIEKSKCGFVSQSEDPYKFSNNIIKFFNLSKSERLILGKNGKTFCKNEFARDKIIHKLINIFNNERYSSSRGEGQ